MTIQPFLKKSTTLLLGSMVLISTALAGTPDAKTVKEVENYLNGLKSYRATIHQTTDTGEKRTGNIYMLRDGQKTYGKLRIEYAPPVEDLFVVDGESCKFYDHQAKEVQNFNVADTPASFLLARHIDLKGDLKVIDQKTPSDGALHLKIVKSGDESGSFLTLKFSQTPFLKMNGWSIKDPQGITQEIQLEDVNIGIPLDANLFRFKK